MSYKIVRKFRDSFRSYTVRRGLSFDEARRRCADPESSSESCTTKTGKDRTRKRGPWFDSYYEDR